MEKLDKNKKSRLFSIFENLDSDIDLRSERNINSDVLIIDGNNNYIRCHCANPAINADGEHIGGIDGFFKSLGYAIRTLQPTRCIVVFDGVGGSQRRRAIYSNYKNKRKSKLRLNRVYEDLDDGSDEQTSILRQMQKVVVLCQNLPVSMMAIDNIEADDSIAFLCTEVFNTDKTENITIMSNDKDFYQLVNKKIKVYSPTKKKIFGPKEVYDEFGITAKNFIYYKILAGDSSDNIDGIKGIKEKTAVKLFPQLSTEDDFTLNEMIRYTQDNVNGKLKAYNNINENVNILHRNYDLMQLGTADFNTHSKLKIQNIINHKVDPTNVYEFTKLLKKYKLFNVIKSHDTWLRDTFDNLDFYAKQS